MTLDQTIRVAADGTVTYGVHVADRAPRVQRVVAAPPMHARNERRYAGLSSIPRGVDQDTTIPHDCGNHLPGRG